MKKLIATTALLTTLAITPALADTHSMMGDLQKKATDAVKDKATVMVEEKTAEVKKDATKKVLTETAKTTAESVGIKGQDEMIEKTVDKGVDLYDANKDKIATIKEKVDTAVTLDKETGTVKIEETVKTVVETKASETEMELGLGEQESLESIEKKLTDVKKTVVEETDLGQGEDAMIDAITPAAGTLDMDASKSLNTITDAVKSVETDAAAMMQAKEEAAAMATDTKTEEKKGLWDTITGFFN